MAIYLVLLCKVMNARNFTSIKLCIYIYKILLAHSKYYTSESPVTSFYQTRFSENSLDCPNYVTASGQKTIDYKMATFWNGLPLTTRKLTNMEDFKATVKTTLLNEEIGL